MKSSLGLDLSFETLKLEFDCITKKIIFNFFQFLVIFGQNREKISIFFQTTEINRKSFVGEVSLPNSEHFLLNNFLSSSEFS